MNKQQLAARIWASANEMRSKIEASEYKDYILGFIFYKFLSDREEQFLLKNGFDRESMETVREDDPETLSYVQNNLGYFISHDDLYSTWLAKGSDFDVSDVRDALSAFSRLIKSQRYRTHMIILNQVGGSVNRIQNPVGFFRRKISVFLFLRNHGNLRKFLFQSAFQEILNCKIHIRHVIGRAFYGNLFFSHFPVDQRPCLLYKFQNMFLLRFTEHPYFLYFPEYSLTLSGIPMESASS